MTVAQEDEHCPMYEYDATLPYKLQQLSEPPPPGVDLEISGPGSENVCGMDNMPEVDPKVAAATYG